MHVRPSDNIHFLLTSPINTWSSTETTYASPMHLLHPLLRVHFKTKSFHHPKKYTHPFAQLCRDGLRGTHSLSLPKVHLDALWQRSIHSHHTSLHNHITHKDITRFKQLFPEAIFHNEDKRATSLRIYCPVIYFQCLTKTFADPFQHFENWKIAQTTLSRRPSPRSPSSLANHTHGLLGLAEIYRMPTSYQNAKNSSWQDDRLLASLQHLFDPC